MSVRLRGSVWYVDYKDAAGSRQRLATNAQTRRQAETLLADIIIREERIRLGLEARDRNPNRWVFGELIKWYLRDVSPKHAGHDRTRSALAVHFAAHPIADLPIEQVTASILEARIEGATKRKMVKIDGKAAWVDTGQRVSAQTRNHLRSYAGRIFADAIRAGHYLGDNPAAKISKERATQRKPSILGLDDVEALLDAADSPWREMFAIAALAGLRLGEIIGLQREDVDLAGGVMHVRRSHSRTTTKGGKARTIPLHPLLVDVLRPALEGKSKSVWLFPGKDGEQRHEHTRATDRLTHALRLAGIDKKLRFHDLRHTCASQLLMAGADLQAVQRILGHSTPVLTIQAYGHLSQTYLGEQMRKMKVGGN